MDFIQFNCMMPQVVRALVYAATPTNPYFDSSLTLAQAADRCVGMDEIIGSFERCVEIIIDTYVIDYAADICPLSTKLITQWTSMFKSI